MGLVGLENSGLSLIIVMDRMVKNGNYRFMDVVEHT